LNPGTAKAVNQLVSWRRIWIAGVLVAATGLFASTSAQASFHLVKIREVYSGGGSQDAYVELQFYAAGQNLLNGRSVTVYDSAGALIHTSEFAANVASGENQRTALVGDTGVQAASGVAPDLVDAGLSIAAAGGAVCWNAAGLPPPDCVSWGDFHGDALLLMNAGTTAGSPVYPNGLPVRTAIHRSIAPGCSTLLEESDDTDDSATDFVGKTPAPRNNAMTPTEMACVGVPNTAIDDKPPPFSNSRSAEFTYEAATATRYECKLDAGAFAVCPATGQTYSGLADGVYTFQVRGVNASGADPTPASYTWTVDTVAPTSTIDTHPVDPSPGASAAFTFHASEQTLRFECSLMTGGQPDAFSTCASGKTYSGLADGTYSFKLRATDRAGNVQATPTAFEWRVDNAVADTTPPDTTIVAKPPDPSTSSNAAFGYSSNEPGSSFECSLDSAPFAACPAGGIAYAGLANGAHTFQVRAIDPSHNVDATPAGYTFSVQVEPIPPPERIEPPQTVLSSKPAKRTSDSTPTFRFRADKPGASFQCALDRGPFKACRSPFTTKRLKPGRHTFSIRAVGNGLTDPTPVRFTFQVVRKGG
jgi:hypothetical protein